MPGVRRLPVGRLRAEPDHFGAVLVLLVGAYVLSVLDDDPWVRIAVTALNLTALVFAVKASQPRPPLRAVVRGIVIAGGVLVCVAFLTLPAEDADGITDCVLVVVLATTLVCIIDRILTAQDVTLRVIAGAISAYLLVGLMFAAVFGVVGWLQGGDFFANGEPPDPETLQYFSFTTITTLGYGDFTAASSAGRGLAALEALVGQIFLATLIARLVSSFRRRPAVTPSQQEDADPT